MTNTKNFSQRTIDKYPGTILETLEISNDELNILIDELRRRCPNLFSDKVTKSYLMDLSPLSDIPGIVNESESLVSSIAADIIGTLSSTIEYLKTTKVQNNSSKNIGTGFDIYEWAKEYNADYYDNNTGYIYHVQEYNRLVKLGLPTIGIKVSENGVLIGYAHRMEK